MTYYIFWLFYRLTILHDGLLPKSIIFLKPNQHVLFLTKCAYKITKKYNNSIKCIGVYKVLLNILRQVFDREEGDIGLFITLVPKVLQQRFLFVGQKTLGTN